MYIQTKTIHGQRYLYAVQSARVDGRPRKVKQVYLGKLDDLIQARQRETNPTSVKAYRFGAVAALWALSEEFDLRTEVDRHCPTSGPAGISIGTYLVLAAINRCIEVHSKRGFAQWYRRTSLERLTGVSADFLSSQSFWTAMDRFPAESVAQPILTAVLKRVLAEVGRPELVSFDASNFYSFIASSNPRPTLAQRGHNKAKRHDLRQVGWALAASAEHQLPLFSYVYAGNQADVTTFKEAWPRLLGVLHELDLKQATLVFDKGNVSKDNLKVADGSGISYVTALPPHFFPDLLAVPVDQFVEAGDKRLQGYRLQRVEREIWKRRRVVVQSWSPELAAGQEAGVRQHMAKAERRLKDLQAALKRRQEPHYRGPRPTKEAVEKAVRQALRAQHLNLLLRVAISQEEGRLELSYEVNQAHLDHLRRHLFGRRIWITDHQDWSAEKILLAAHQQSDCENCFRDLHGEDPLGWTPVWHWTDQKIRVHAFYMVLGLLLTRLLVLRARGAGDDRGLKALIGDLDAVEECLLVYPAAGPTGQGRPRLVSRLTDRSPQQQRLLEATGADALAPSP